MASPGTVIDRERAAADLLREHRGRLLRVAARHSRCREDAEDALQRASLILLTKSPACDPPGLVAWMVVVTRHEAMAVRRARERLLAWLPPAEGGDPLEATATDAVDPAEAVEREERLAEARARLGRLKPDERLAIVLQAQGYSYAEICRMCRWTRTKVNRCLAEGRARLRGDG